jgi:hypothetical protein
MKTKRMFCLISLAALSLTGTVASAAMHGSPMMSRPAMTRSAPHFSPSTMTGRHRFFSDRFRRFHNNRTFIFVDTFGFPFFYPYPYPYYGYYPYAYYGYSDYEYGYGNATVVEVQRRLARAGYYHGAIDGIMGPQTRRAIRAYERDHNAPAYGVIDGRPLTMMGLA